jgi:hypothetical protein
MVKSGILLVNDTVWKLMKGQGMLKRSFLFKENSILVENGGITASFHGHRASFTSVGSDCNLDIHSHPTK